MKSDGFKVLLASQICCADIGGATMSSEWWNAWFSEYEKIALYFADKAEKYHVEMLDVTADWNIVGADPAKRPADYKERLEAIYAKVRTRYHGKLGRSFFLGGLAANVPDLWPKPSSMPFMENADFFTVNWWVGITDKNNPTQAELNANVKKMFDARFAPLYDQYKKPIVLRQVAYPSIAGGLKGDIKVDDPATAMWEPYSDKYTLDLVGQAMGFEALMINIANAPYITGLYPFSYWPDDFPLSKEQNVRGKPAEEVLSQWYKFIVSAWQ